MKLHMKLHFWFSLLIILLASTSFAQMSKGTSKNLLMAGQRSTSTDTPVTPGYALNFDGTNNLLFTGGSSNWNAGVVSGTTQMTFTCWFKIDSLAAYRTIIEKSNLARTLRSFTIEISNTGYILMDVYRDGSTVKEVLILANPITNKWYYLACVADGINLNIYTNGIVCGGAGANTAYNGILRSGSYCKIGAKVNGVTPFDGTIDEPALWGRGLTSNEIWTMYNNGVGVKGDISQSPWSSNMVFGYHLDDNTGTNCADFSGNNYTNTILGTARWTNGIVPL